MIPLISNNRQINMLNSSINYLIAILIICILSISVNAMTHSVQTYRQSSTQLGQLVTSSTLVWESYNGDKKQLEFAIKGGSYLSDEVLNPIYVCRASVEGLYVSGHTEKRMQKYICAVSSSGKAKAHHVFDILVNKGRLGKIAWKSWRKIIPVGAIVVTMASGLSDATYVARHVNRKHQGNSESNEIAGADFNLGRLDPSIGLGKIFVSDGEYEHEYNDGEVLVEAEPFRYELKDIVLDKDRMDVTVNTTELGSSILANRDDTEGTVETVISFKYNRAQYWGTYDGVARGLPTTVHDGGKSSDNEPDEVKWGLRYIEARIETKAVSTSLSPGTALNVTLKGNYTTIESPYVAILIAYYNGSDEKVSRTISSTLQKSTLKDIKLEFSPVYWIDNGTLIPTTTTTTTTEPTTTTTDEPKPITEPKIQMNSIGPSSIEYSSSSNEIIHSTNHSTESPGNVEKGGFSQSTHRTVGSTGVNKLFNNSLVVLLTVFILLN